MNDITYAVSVDVNNPIIPYNVYVASVLDSNVRYLEVTLYENGNVIALSNEATATASLVTDNVLVDGSVNCTISDNIITVPLEDLQRHGNLDVQVTVTEGEKVLAIPFPIQVRVTPNIAEDARIDENSMGSYAEVVQEIAAARGDYPDLKDRLDGEIDRIDDDISDINTALAAKANTADVTAALAAKANAATTLAGYGIADAYTKAQIDEMRNVALFGVRDLDLYDTTLENANDNVILFLFGYDNNNSPTCGLDKLTEDDYGKVWHIVLTFTKANLAGSNSVTVQEHRRGQPLPDTLQHYDNVAQGDVIRFDYTMSDGTASILRLRLNARAGEQKVHVTISEVRQLNDVLDTLDTKANAADMNTALAAKADAADLPDFNEMEYASRKVDRISSVNNVQPADSVNYPSVNAVKALLGDGYFTRTESNPTVTAGFAGSGVPIFVSGNTMFSAGACTGNIVTLFVPRTVTKIDGGAFINCASLTDVYIDNEAKSDDNPNGIEITSGAFGNSVTVHYNAKFNAVTQLIMAIHAGVS